LPSRVPGGVVVEPGLRSEVEDRWRSAYQKAGGSELPALREADSQLVAEDSERLGAAGDDGYSRTAIPSRSVALGIRRGALLVLSPTLGVFTIGGGNR
jgi:hypothetical protein